MSTIVVETRVGEQIFTTENRMLRKLRDWIGWLLYRLRRRRQLAKQKRGDRDIYPLW
jgi:hypothetical protein